MWIMSEGPGGNITRVYFLYSDSTLDKCGLYGKNVWIFTCNGIY